MDRTADLEAALRFVIGRVEEQARLSGERLSEERLFLLKHLPSPSRGAFTGYYVRQLLPRDTNYERLCALGKAAYRRDRESNPSSNNWDFAFSVFELNRHPMWGLLHWAGLKHPRPSWDRVLLVIAALVFIAAAVVVFLLAGEAPWTLYKWIGVGMGYVTIVCLTSLVARRVGERQLENEIEKYRRGCRFRGVAP